MNKHRTIFLPLALLLFFGLFISCQERTGTSESSIISAEIDSLGSFRPNFHFTPNSGWMNDPNGMFFLNGTYHLFFQHNPDDIVWGPMHWGHATSKDLITWKEQPIALEPDENGTIFSGSAVYDRKNTSGLGTEENPPVIAIFTYHDTKGAEEGRKDYQTQAIAYSLDKGKTFKKYEGNPVISNPGIEDFRDPKVTWDNYRKQWVMVLAAGNETLIYGSSNLIDWEILSEFGNGFGAHGGVWECPDFFPMEVENSNEVKWVMIQSLNPGGYNGGSGTQYFIGEFDGIKFTPDSSMADLGEDHSYWIDFGKDNYAGVTWSNVPQSDGRTLFIGWMSNWQYANEVPTDSWRSATTVARELTLKKVDGTYRIFSEPAKELYDYIVDTYEEEKIKVEAYTPIVSSSKIDLTETIIDFQIADLEEQVYNFILTNTVGDTLKFGYNHSERQFYLNRKKSGLIDFSEKFAENISIAPRTSNSNKLSIQIVLDKTSIELFFDEGETVMTEIFFPRKPYTSFSASSKEGFVISDLKINQLNFN